jgi:hypothetical protein
MADSDGSASEIARPPPYDARHRGGGTRAHALGSALAGLLLSATSRALLAPIGEGPYARIAVLRPHDGDTVDFEAGYIRHLDFHPAGRDTWSLVRLDGLGRRTSALVRRTPPSDTPRPAWTTRCPGGDERDNVCQRHAHAEFAGQRALRVPARPSRAARRAVADHPRRAHDRGLASGTASAFEVALAARSPSLSGETLWYRMVAGGAAPRYVRLHPQPTLAAILEARNEQALPDRRERVDHQDDGGDPQPAAGDELRTRDARSPVMAAVPGLRHVRGACALDCPDTCAWIVTVKDGQPVDLRGDPDHPFTRGIAVQQGRGLPRVRTIADRLRHPLPPHRPPRAAGCSRASRGTTRSTRSARGSPT